jgi:predicted aspartyl protease
MGILAHPDSHRHCRLHLAVWLLCCLLLLIHHPCGLLEAQELDGAQVERDAVAELLQCHLDAVGGRDRILALSEAKVTSTVKAFGLKGLSTTWTRAPNLIRNELDLGFVTQSAMFDGHGGWKVDGNRRASRMEGQELEALVGRAVIASHLYCFPEINQLSYVFLGPTKRDGRTLLCLEVSPPGGVPARLYFDADSCLLVRSEIRHGDLESVTDYGDFREVDGVLFPFYWRHSTGDPRFDVETRVQTVTFDPEVDDRFFTMAEAEEVGFDCRLANGDAAEGIPIRLATDLILIRVSVNGVEGLHFLLDTGASVSVINESLVDELGLERRGRLVEVIGAAGRGEASFTRVDSIAMPGLELVNQRLLAVDLDPFLPYVGHRVDGILGYDFISRFVLKIDYQNQTLSAYRPSAYRYSGEGQVLALDLQGNLPVIEGLVEDRHGGRFLLDTGASAALVLHQEFIEEFQLLRGKRDRREVFSGGVGGVVRQISARLEAFGIGKYRFPDLPTLFSLQRPGSGRKRRTPVSGKIGATLLNHFTICLDYSRSQVVFEPNRFYSEPVRVDRSGMQLVLSEDQVVVAGVARRSPARRAGLKVFDRLVKLDGQPAAELGLPYIRDVLRGPAGSRVRLLVTRQDKERTVTLKLKDYR